jgi:heat shock protein HspQ
MEELELGGETLVRDARFRIGQVVRHRIHPFRGVIFDVDPSFNQTEEWWLAIPEQMRPRKDQPYYHLLAENEKSYYVAYVSEQNLLADETGEPVGHPQIADIFGKLDGGFYEPRLHRPRAQ